MVQLVLVIGGKGTGKTYRTKMTYFTIDKAFLDNNILIFDYNNEYTNVKEIRVSEVSEFCKQEIKDIGRIICNQQLSLTDYCDLFLSILEDFNKGIFITDCFVDMNRSNDIYNKINKLLVRSKHMKDDLQIVLHFQNRKSIPQMWLKFKENIVFKETDENRVIK